jgi:diguanylate cyclase (GGDEF)-like protein
VTEADWNDERARTKRVAQMSLLVIGLFVPALSLTAFLLTHATATGTIRYPVMLGWMFLLMLPLNYLIFRMNIRQQAKSDHVVDTLTRQLSEALAAGDQEARRRAIQVHRQEFESRLANALDMAEGEPEVIDVIERSFASTFPDSPIELLLADNSHAHLLRMATASPTGLPPNCGVDSPDHCPAARRTQVQRFADSEELDACPKLRGRGGDAVSALCVPVSIMGRTVGVIHATAEANTTFPEDKVQDVGTLAKLAGARIGLLRVMAETQLQAATDTLTGLLNRRSFEQQVSVVRRDATALSVAMADLDHFKDLNDTYGHDTGDRALRLFASVLRASVRAEDLVCRHGGEEFVIAIPGCPAATAGELLDALRSRLDAAVTVAGLPKFTVSFGVIDAREFEDLPTLISRADAALFQAKHDGRDCVIIHDPFGNPMAAKAGTRDSLGSDSRQLLQDKATRPGALTNTGDTQAP